MQIVASSDLGDRHFIIGMLLRDPLVPFSSLLTSWVLCNDESEIDSAERAHWFYCSITQSWERVFFSLGVYMCCMSRTPTSWSIHLTDSQESRAVSAKSASLPSVIIKMMGDGCSSTVYRTLEEHVLFMILLDFIREVPLNLKMPFNAADNSMRIQHCLVGFLISKSVEQMQNDFPQPQNPNFPFWQVPAV